jgi:phage terminase large subunit
MPELTLPANGWRPRGYQLPLWAYLELGGKYAVAVWHRRAGKDEVALHHTAIAAHKRIGNYWHMLPQYAQARRAIWDAINPHTARRRIDEAFPIELRKKTNDHEMKIEFKCGSIWQVVGSDNFNSLVGSPPIGIVYSEWSLADPMAHAYLAPILAENGGWAVFIYTARGYNHGYSTYTGAQSSPGAFAELLTVADTHAVSDAALAQVMQDYKSIYGDDHGDSLHRQEFYNDWSAANIGAVMGQAIERAERSGRIVDFDGDDQPVEISSDIGFRDTAAFWFWRAKLGGFDVVDYCQGVGQDADGWCEELSRMPYKIAKIWLPHDAKNKTFASKHSAQERFAKSFGWDKVFIVPDSRVSDRINAARLVAERCRFHKTKCKDGLNGLRSWSYDYDEEKRIYSREPRHDWASHPGDGFSYGAQIMRERIKADEPKLPQFQVGVPVHGQINAGVTIEDLIKQQTRKRLAEV